MGFRLMCAATLCLLLLACGKSEESDKGTSAARDSADTQAMARDRRSDRSAAASVVPRRTEARVRAAGRKAAARRSGSGSGSGGGGGSSGGSGGGSGGSGGVLALWHRGVEWTSD